MRCILAAVLYASAAVSALPAALSRRRGWCLCNLGAQCPGVAAGGVCDTAEPAAVAGAAVASLSLPPPPPAARAGTVRDRLCRRRRPPPTSSVPNAAVSAAPPPTAQLPAAQWYRAAAAVSRVCEMGASVRVAVLCVVSVLREGCGGLACVVC